MRKINYYPELVKVTGSINAALMMAQLEFWFATTRGKAFYKFLAPCDSERYKEGDSWQEELSMSKAEIRTAFSRIGVVYKSKKAFDASSDIFQGKPYASYYDRIRKVTFYHQNTEEVERIWEAQKLKPLILKEEKERNSGRKTGLGNQKANSTEERHDQQKEIYRDEKDVYRDGKGVYRDEKGDFTEINKEEVQALTKESSVNDDLPDGLYRDYINNKTQIKTAEESPISVPYIEICHLYNEYLGDDLGHKQDLTSRERKKASFLYLDRGRRLEDFQKAFKKAGKSRFLCGRVKGKKWRASLIWLLEEENLTKVLEGWYDDFSSGYEELNEQIEKNWSDEADGKTYGGGVSRKIQKFNAQESHDWDFDEIERLEQLYIDQKLADMRE